MNVKKFIAPSSREALRKVRDALGAEAIILSNRSIDHGVEILAMASDDVAALAEPVIEQEAVPVMQKLAERAAPMATPTTAPLHSAMNSTMYSTTPIAVCTLPAMSEMTVSAVAPAPIIAPVFIEQTGPVPAVIRRRPVNQSVDSHQASGLAEALEAARGLAQAAEVAKQTSESLDLVVMMNEIKSMRGLLETQLAELSWSHTSKREPARAEILQDLLIAGFSPAMARYLIEKLPAGHNKQQGLNWVKTMLTRNLVTMDSSEEIVEQGGVYALVGPTGVGKTTTTAKLAARVVMRHGPGKLALITTDGYRIGGHEQLRIYGKILGVMVHSVKDAADLRIALNELKGKHTVLIDTAGLGQRDQMVSEQTAMLAGVDVAIKRLLCLPATSTCETLNEVVQAYQSASSSDTGADASPSASTALHGCIITKLDEAVTLGSVLDTVVRQKLNLYYIANGQRVPEDLHLANRDYLIDKAFKLKHDTTTFALNEDELPMVMAHAQLASSMPSQGVGRE